MFFGGFVRMHVLYHAVKEPIFGVEMMEELARHGYDVAQARFTRCFTSSNRPATCPCTPRSSPASSGNTTAQRPKAPPRLEAAKAKLKELVAEVLDDEPPRTSIRSDGSARKRRKHTPSSKR